MENRNIDSLPPAGEEKEIKTFDPHARFESDSLLLMNLLVIKNVLEEIGVGLGKVKYGMS